MTHSTHRPTIIDAGTLQRYRNKGSNICKKCEKDFKIGDRVIVIYTSQSKAAFKTKKYHNECFKNMLY